MSFIAPFFPQHAERLGISESQVLILPVAAYPQTNTSKAPQKAIAGTKSKPGTTQCKTKRHPNALFANLQTEPMHMNRSALSFPCYLSAPFWACPSFPAL